MELKSNDFVKVAYDMHANGKLVQTTDEQKGKEAGLDTEEYKPVPMVLGKGFILKALDDDILKQQDEKEHTIELSAEEAFGKRQKDLIKTFPKTAFDEQQVRPVVGVTYDFNGTYGTVKSVNGGRVMVDFNNPLAGKDISIHYRVLEKITDLKEKVGIVFERVLRIPSHMFEVGVEASTVTLKVPEQLVSVKDMLQKSLVEQIPEIEEYELQIETFKKN